MSVPWATLVFVRTLNGFRRSEMRTFKASRGASTAVCAALTLVALLGAPAASAATFGEQTFTSTGVHAVTVPAGVTRVDITAIGGDGGDVVSGGAGGLAAVVTGTATVSPGEELTLTVAGNGEPSTAGGNGGTGEGSGGVGTAVDEGGGGGGGSAVFDGPTALVIAGGGGGGGGYGPGGNAEQAGSGGLFHQGQGGSQTGPGEGGYENTPGDQFPYCENGSGMNGGNAAAGGYEDGGGGGGLFGGGVGCFGGGGGGGSSLIPAGGSSGLDENGAAPQITITLLGTDPTATTVTCSPSSVTTGSVSTCTATVADTASSGATTPTGTVDFTSSPTSGSFSSFGSCTLVATSSTGIASCQVTFTPSADGGYTITGTYTGDSTHETASGTASLQSGANCPSEAVAVTLPAISLSYESSIKPYQIKYGQLPLSFAPISTATGATCSLQATGTLPVTVLIGPSEDEGDRYAVSISSMATATLDFLAQPPAIPTCQWGNNVGAVNTNCVVGGTGTGLVRWHTAGFSEQFSGLQFWNSGPLTYYANVDPTASVASQVQPLEALFHTQLVAHLGYINSFYMVQEPPANLVVSGSGGEMTGLPPGPSAKPTKNIPDSVYVSGSHGYSAVLLFGPVTSPITAFVYGPGHSPFSVVFDHVFPSQEGVGQSAEQAAAGRFGTSGAMSFCFQSDGVCNADSSLRIARQKVTVGTRGSVFVKVNCAGVPCSGRVKLTTAVKVPTRTRGHEKSSREVLTIGSGWFVGIAVGPHKLALTLDRAGLRLFRRHGNRLPGVVTASYNSGTTGKTASADVSLQPARAKRR
jgi:hypothetical protein